MNTSAMRSLDVHNMSEKATRMLLPRKKSSRRCMYAALLTARKRWRCPDEASAKTALQQRATSIVTQCSAAIGWFVSAIGALLRKLAIQKMLAADSG